MSNRFFITILVVIALIFGGFVITKNKGKSNSGTDSSVQPTNHVRGNTSSKVTLVEYGDFQCPACGQYYPIVEQVYEKYKDQISFQFRNFPLVQIHQNAFAAHRASEAAASQDKFWEMYKALYEGQQSWASSSNPTVFFTQYAEQMDLNIDKFKTDSASQAVNDLINADITAGQSLQITGTPAFVLNGEKIENPQSLDAFTKVIDAAIKAKKSSN